MISSNQPLPSSNAVLLEEIKLWIERERDQLAGEYVRALRAILFTNRPEIRPALLGRIAAAEIDALLAYCATIDNAAAITRGKELCRSGLGEESVLRLGQVTRRFCLFLPDELRI